MYATQYEITLPAHYDMGIIRKRVAAGGAALDSRAGLGLKAYVIGERGVNGAPVNVYAPFYLWTDPGAMAAFFAGGGGFHNIVRDFGRPAVLQATGLACVAGPGRTGAPRSASRTVTALPREAEGGLESRTEQALAETAELAGRPGVHTAALALDLGGWRLISFVLWTDPVAPEEPGSERYEVLHLSAPGLPGLPDGRCW